MPTPSLLIVPARFKSGKLYSQIPTSGAGDFTVTRATTATRVNASGFIESVASGIPRLDYLASGGTVGCPALLVEPSGTNGIRNNSMVGAVAGSPGTLPTNWILGGVGLVQQIVEVGTENGVSYIDLRLSGTATAGTATLSFESATQIAALTGQNWTISSYLKTIALPSPPTSFVLAITERTLGGTIVVQQTTNVSLTSTLARYSYSPTLNGGATTAFAQPRLFFTLVVGQAYDFTIRVGYPQMELGSVATSVIPTTTAAVTRNADVISVTGASGSIGQTEGTIYAEFFVDFNNRDADIFSVDGGSTSDGFFMSIRNSSVVQLIVRTASANALIFQRAGTYPTGVNKLAVAYKNGDFAICLNGTTVQTNTSSITMPSVSINRASLCRSGLYTLNQQIRIRAAALYNTRLTNAELVALTTP